MEGADQCGCLARVAYRLPGFEYSTGQHADRDTPAVPNALQQFVFGDDTIPMLKQVEQQIEGERFDALAVSLQDDFPRPNLHFALLEAKHDIFRRCSRLTLIRHPDHQ